MRPPCEFCEKARINPLHTFFSPACLWCGARLVARLRELKDLRPRGEIKTRQEKVLTDWEAYGHSRKQMLELSRGPIPLSPTGSDSSEASEPQSKGRRR